MVTKQPTTNKDSSELPDEFADVTTQTKVPAQHDQLPGPATLDPLARHQMIACAAYYLAEKRSFVGDAESQRRDWLEAEADIDRMPAGPTSNPCEQANPSAE